jgi:uncharacterized repeat protein (TIGR03803 family)
MSHRVMLFGVLVSALVFPPVSSAQATYEMIYRFGGPVGPLGRLAEAPDGSLFGMTYQGGRFGAGTIFALRPSPGGRWPAEVVHDFEVGSEGGFPWGSLISGRDGNFYGLTTTNTWPSPNHYGGTMFRMTPSGEFSLVHTFSGLDGNMPVWRLLEARDGNFYGSTCNDVNSTVFRVTPTGSFTVLFRLYVPPPPWPPNPIGFPFWTLGVCPVTELWEGPDGFLYGQATYGGPYNPVVNGGGTLFRIDPRDNPPERFTLVHAFSGAEGAQPVGGLVPGPDGTLYGSAYQGSPLGQGSIFRTQPTGGVTTVHAFEGPDGAHPYGGLFPAADGSLYGTAAGGGTGYGTLFKIDVGGQFSRLHAFNGTDGQAPVEVMQARDGKFYGVTYRGGPGRGGTAYRLNPDDTVETLHAFVGVGYANSGVIEAPDGNLYGTTSHSTSGDGTVFKLSPARQLTVLHDFEPYSSDPSGLTLAADGYLYGTTSGGGTHNRGTVFRIGTTGGHTVLHSFADDATGSPRDGVVQGSDGNFYGLAERSVYKMDASGNLTTLHTFTPAEGGSPSGPLVEGTDGSLYGTMRSPATVFKVTTSGEFSLLHSFDGSDGSSPSGGLTRARDGRLYGVTRYGGASGHGTLFRLEAAGGVTTLHHFGELEGYPDAVLAGRDGVLYGVASTGFITIGPPLFFRFTTDLTIVYTSGPADGMGASRLIQGSDGAFYGSMSSGAWGHYGGGVFRLEVPPTIP